VELGVDGILVLAGEGPQLSIGLELASELGVLDRVRPLGLVEDITALLPLADIFLFPSDGESFGLAPLESLLCEVPVVGAVAGGLPEVVDDGHTGFLSPVGDTESMARACLELLEPGKKVAMGKEGRRRSVARFTPAAIVPQYEELYRELIARRGRCPEL
jgi:glycosyltransferase involved in cell wall biosynthesis